jgi:hypothetical protein
MSCRRIEKSLALYAGGDLPPKKAAKVRAHVDACPICRDVVDDLRAARNAAKTLARAEDPGDWREGDWQALLRSVAAARPAARRPVVPAAFRPWAVRPVAVVALALLLVAAGAFFALRKTGSPGALQSAVRIAEPPTTALPPGPEKPKPTILRIVTKDGQLRVVWPFDSDFNLSRYGK